MKLPKDLAGYQLVSNTRVLSNDIVIPQNNSYPDGGWAWQYFAHRPSVLLGENGLFPIYGDNGNMARVYRKIECPRKLDESVAADPCCSPKIVIDESYKALTNDQGKAPLAMLPWAGIEEVALVQAYGNEKYGDFYNYRKGMEVTRHLGCALRHIAKFLSGETLDRESKRPHLAHAACRILYVLQNQHDGTAIDDRFKK